MHVLLIANEAQKKELMGQLQANEDLHVQWEQQPISTTNEFDACIDLLFENSAERNHALKQLQTPLIIVNAVVDPLVDIGEDFIRINGWATFLQRSVVEVAGNNVLLKEKTEQLFLYFGKKTEWVNDVPGLITARVIASVINEAFFALQEEVSSRQEIDMAMKLGTNYPYGPFEWSDKIGVKNIHALLDRLSAEEKRYTPAVLLTKEAEA